MPNFTVGHYLLGARMKDQIDVLIEEAKRFSNLEITKTEDTITLTENGIVFGKVKAHFTADGQLIAC
jgi:hypothetical protein